MLDEGRHGGTWMGSDGQIRVWIGAFVCRDTGEHGNASRKGTNGIGWTYKTMENTSAKWDTNTMELTVGKCTNKIKTHTPNKSIIKS